MKVPAGHGACLLLAQSLAPSPIQQCCSAAGSIHLRKLVALGEEGQCSDCESSRISAEEKLHPSAPAAKAQNDVFKKQP